MSSTEVRANPCAVKAAAAASSRAVRVVSVYSSRRGLTGISGGEYMTYRWYVASHANGGAYDAGGVRGSPPDGGDAVRSHRIRRARAGPGGAVRARRVP